MIHQKRHKGIAEGLLHHDALGPVGQVGVLDDGVGVVAHDERAVLQSGGGVGLVVDHLAGRQAVRRLAVLHPRLGTDGMVRRHRIGVVLHGVGLSAVVVERAEEAVVLADLILRQAVGRDALGGAELHIGVVGAQPRPVVVGAEVDILAAMGHQRIVERYRLYIVPHGGQNILLRLSLIAAGDVAVQRVRQRDAAGQRHSHGVHGADTGELVSHGCHDIRIVLGQTVHVVVHLEAGIAHHIHAAGLVGCGVGGDGVQRLIAGRLLGVVRLLTVLPALSVRAVVGLLPVVRLRYDRVIRRRRRLIFFEYVRKNSQSAQHQRRQHDHQQQGGQRTAAAAIAAAAICPARAHFTYSLMMPRAVSASEVTHSTTQVP